MSKTHAYDLQSLALAQRLCDPRHLVLDPRGVVVGHARAAADDEEVVVQGVGVGVGGQDGVEEGEGAGGEEGGEDAVVGGVEEGREGVLGGVD